MIGQISTLQAWGIISALGLLINALGYNDARRDLKAIKRRKQNGVLRMAARSNVAREIHRILVQAAFLGIALLGTYAPTNGNAMIALFFLVQAVLVGGALADRVIRHRMIEYDRRAAMKDAAGRRAE